VTEDEDLREKQRAYQHEYYTRNRDQLQAKRRVRYEANREQLRELNRIRRTAYHQRLKQAVFTAYGNCCACCGENNPGFLSIDHVNGGGRAHRQAVGGTVMVWRDIVKRGFPPDFQLLCYNCNLGRYFNGGDCPHKDGTAFTVSV
jgi:hypothetical protein